MGSIFGSLENDEQEKGLLKTAWHEFTTAPLAVRLCIFLLPLNLLWVIWFDIILRNVKNDVITKSSIIAWLVITAIQILYSSIVIVALIMETKKNRTW